MFLAHYGYDHTFLCILRYVIITYIGCLHYIGCKIASEVLQNNLVLYVRERDGDNAYVNASKDTKRKGNDNDVLPSDIF